MLSRFSPEARADWKPLLQIQFPSDWLKSLSDLLKSLNKDPKRREFQTVDALLAAAAFDDPLAGLMLKRILVWHGSIGDEFYLSQQDWWEQCRVKRSTIERVKSKIFPLIGVALRVAYTGKANTTWYRVREWHFLRRLGEVLKLPMLYLADRLCAKPAERYAENQQNVTPESSGTLTIDSTHDSSVKDVVNDTNHVASEKIVDFPQDTTPEQQRVIDLLKSAGIHGQAYVQLPEATVQACIESSRNAVKVGRIQSSRFIPYLKGALKKHLGTHDQAGQTTTPSSKNFTPEIPTDTAAPPPNPLPVAEGEWAETLRRLREGRNAGVQPETAPANLAVMVNDKLTAHQAWDAAYHQLSLQLARSTFDTYLRAATLTGFEADCFMVRVHNAYARDMLQHRHQLYNTATRILRDVTGRDVSIRYETDDVAASAGQGLRRFLDSANQVRS